MIFGVFDLMGLLGFPAKKIDVLLFLLDAVASEDLKWIAVF